MSRHYAIFHLFNDYSGSPKVLKIVIEQMLDDDCIIDLYTSRGGPLDSISHPNFRLHHIPYAFSESRLLTSFRYGVAQIISFFAALRYTFSARTEFYINTIMPLGAAVAAKLTGHRLTLHCHEVPGIKGKVYNTLIYLMTHLADKVICVSQYQADRITHDCEIEIYRNSLSKVFIRDIAPDPESAFDRKTILMLSSLKEYKGIPQFFSIAENLPDYKFMLVINDTQAAIDEWFGRNHIIPAVNVTVYTQQADVANFYNNSSIVLNLSDPDLFVETFGMTALEARACRLPLIVPTVGGIADQVIDGINGYHINCNDTPRICAAIRELLTDRDHYLRLAAGETETTNNSPITA